MKTAKAVACLAGAMLLLAGRSFSGAAFPTATAAAAAPLDPAVAGLIAAQKKIANLTADFTLRIGGAGQDGADFVAGGKVWLASGRRYRVEYASPESQLLVSDGQQRWLYLEKINQVQVQSLPAGGNPREFFLELGGGLPDLIRRCRVEHVRKKAAADAAEIFTLIPLPGQDLQFDQATLWVQARTWLPLRVEIQAGRPVTVQFSSLRSLSRAELKKKPGRGIPQEMFTFTPPADAEVIENLWQ